MAVANTKSGLITNLDATPPVVNDIRVAGGAVRCQAATVEVAAADDAASTFRLFRIHSSDRIDKIELLNDAITAGTSYDLGVYKTAADGGAVVDADVFGTAIDMSSARVTPLDATFEALNIDQIAKKLWEVLALASDPDLMYDIVLTANTPGTAAGTISGRCYFVMTD